MVMMRIIVLPCVCKFYPSTITLHDRFRTVQASKGLGCGDPNPSHITANLTSCKFRTRINILQNQPSQHVLTQNQPRLWSSSQSGCDDVRPQTSHITASFDERFPRHAVHLPEKQLRHRLKKVSRHSPFSRLIASSNYPKLLTPRLNIIDTFYFCSLPRPY